MARAASPSNMIQQKFFLAEAVHSRKENPYLEAMVWCRWHADGSVFVDWERAQFLANLSTGSLLSGDPDETRGSILATVMLAARGKIPETTFAMSEQKGVDAYRAAAGLPPLPRRSVAVKPPAKAAKQAARSARAKPVGWPRKKAP